MKNRITVIFSGGWHEFAEYCYKNKENPRTTRRYIYFNQKHPILVFDDYKTIGTYWDLVERAPNKHLRLFEYIMAHKRVNH